MKKRIISLCLVFCMLLSYMPVGALAAEGEDFGEVVEELAQEQEKSAEALPEETTEEPAEATAEELPPEPTEEESAEEQPAEEEPAEEEPAEEELAVEVEAPAAPVVLTATAEDGVQVVLTAEAGAFTDGEVALTAGQLTLTAHVVTGLEAEAAQAEIDSANLVAAITYDICVMYGGVELQPVPGKSVNVAFVVPAVPEEAEAVEVVHHDEEGKVETVVEKQEVDASSMVEVAPVVEELVSEVADEFTQETEAVVEETVAALPEEAVEILAGTVPSFSYYTVVFTYEPKTALVDCATTKNDLTILSESVGIPLKENTAVIITAELYEDASCQGSAVESGIIRNERGSDILRVYHDEQMKWYLDCVEEFEASYGLKLTTDKGQVYIVTLRCVEQTERKAYIRSALTHETDHLRVSELLEVVALGFSPDADLEYKYEIKGNSGNTRYASLNMYNSMNQLERYSGEWDSDATTNNSGVTPSGKNYSYFALQDKSNQTRCWNQDKCTVTVTVTNRNKRSETAVATYSGFEPSNLKTDVESTLLIVFVGEEQQITTLYGLNGVVHIDCSNSEVRDGRIEDTSIATCGDGSIIGVSAGVTALTVTVEKDHDCDHHSVSNGQWVGTTAEACKNTVYVVNQPKVTGEGEITFENVPVGVTITLNGVSLTSTDPSVPLVFKGLTPGESYTVTASVYDTGTKAEAITEAEIIVPDGKTEHTYIFVHQDVSGETLEGASVKIEPTTLMGDSKELRITPIPPEGYRATSAKGYYQEWDYFVIIPYRRDRTPTFVLQKDGSFVVDEGSMDPIDNITITITYEQHKHSWKYESAKTAADNDTIKAYCVNTGHTGVGTADNPDKVVISAQNWTYDGNGHGATLSQNSVGGVNGLTIQYQSWNGSTYVPMSGTPTNVGQYRASVTAGGATAYTIYKIEALDLSALATAAGPAAKTYTGSSIKPTDVVVSYDGKELVLGTDYTLEYGENKNAGKGTVIVSFRGNYTGSLTQEFDILPKAVTVKADDKSVVAGENAPEFTAKVTGTVNEETVVYTLSSTYDPGVSGAGEYDITPTGDETQGNYTVTFEPGTLTVTEPKVLVIVTSSAEYEGVYDGESHGSAVEVTGSDSVTVQYSTDGGTTWSEEYPTIKDVGVVEVLVKASAEDCEDATASYVLKATAAPATVKAKDNGKIYDEADPALTAEVTGLFGTDELSYTVTRAEGEDVGTYAITASGDEEQGNYTVSYENAVFTIEAKDISETAKVDAIPDQTYTGEVIMPKPDVYDGDKKLTEGTDFVYEYTDEEHDNTTIGENTGIVKVIFIGNYAGATSVEFAIVEGEQSYTVVYTYNGTLGSGPIPGGTGKYGEWTKVTADKQTNYLDAAYALDSIEQHQLELDNDKNIVYVNYARDSIGKNAELSDDPSDISIPDGVPDKYQVVVSFSIENGVWDEETGYDGEIADIYTLCEYDDATEKWVLLTGEDVPTLKVPTGMKPAAGYQQSKDKGEWLKPQPVEGSPVTTGAEYTYSYGNQKDQFTVTVSVENGTVDATLVDGKTTVVYGEDCVLTFTPNTGYTLSSVTADKDSSKTLLNGVFTFTEVKEDHEITVVYEAGTYGYYVQYFYDGKPGDAPEGAKTTGEGTYGSQSDLTPADFAELTVTGFAFNKLENCTITETAAANIAKVYYTTDTMGDTEDPANKGDGTPDEYQALVTYSIENGTWVEGDKAKKSYVFDLCEMDDSGAWVPVEVTPTLEGTVPTGMKPDAAYQQATGQWTPSVPTEETEVTESVDYLFSYGEEQDKFTIGIGVNGGKAYPDDTSKTVTYGGSYKVWFVADEGMALDTVMLTVGEEDPVPAELSADGSYTFTDVKENRSIDVTFSADEKSTNPDDPDKGDGIPDKYQVPVTFTVEGGVIKDSEDTGKTVYVTLFDDKHIPSAEGEGYLTVLQIPETSGNEGYTVDKGWDTDPAEATITKEETFTYTYEKGTFGYSIEYYYDGKKDEAETDSGEALFESATAVTADEKKEHGGNTYALDTIEQCESIGTDEESNVVKVKYLLDEYAVGEKNEKVSEPDGIPDSYQATVTYSIKNGSWNDKGDKADKIYFYTLKVRDGNVWNDVEPAHTLDDTIPTGMQPDEAYKKKAESAKWNVPITSETPVTGDAEYLFSYGDETDTFTITVTVVNGKSVPSTTVKTVNFGEGYEVCFQPEDKTYVLDTVTINGNAAALDEYNSYTFTNVKEDKTIIVTFSTDVKGDPADPENKGDGIPDKYQVPVTFTFVNGVIADTEDSSKTVYVTKLDEKGERSETGKAKLTNTEIPATEGTEGYVKAEPFWDNDPAEAEITEAVTFTGTYELGKFGYTIEYTFDEEPGTAPEGAPTEGEQTFGESTDEKVADYEKYEVEGYALDTIEQCESIGTDEAGNVVKVKYAKDETGPEGESDGIPDKYQATVTYSIYHGTWDEEGDKADKTYFYTLKVRDGNEWKPAEPAHTLGDTIPEGMKPDAEYSGSEGKWDKVFDADTEITETVTYTFSYGDEKDKIKITVAVENGTADPSDTEVEVEYGGSYTVRFKPNTGYKLDSVKVDGETAELTDGAYTFENVTAPRSIEVNYVADEFAYTIQYYYDGVKGDSESGGTATFGQSTTVAPTDPKVIGSINYMMGSVEQCVITAEPAKNIVRVYYLSDMLGNDSDDPTNPNKPDNIPDLYQVVVTFKAVNGTVDGTNAKTAVVLNKFDGQGKQSADGTAHLVNVPNPVPNTGYVAPETGIWSPAEPTTTLDIKENETFTATYVLGKYGYSIQYYYDGTKGDLVSGGEADFGTETAVKAEATVTVSGETEKHYALGKVVQCTIGTTATSNIVEVYYLSDEKGGVNQNNPDEPDLPDGIPDTYEAVVKFSVTEGTGTVTENRYAVVPLYGEDGELSASGKGHLSAEQLPQTAPATGYVVPETGFWSPAEPDTSADITEDCEFIATYVLGEYAYTIRYYYDGVEGDKVEGSKAEFGSTPSVTPEPKRSYSDKTYAYDSITLCTIGTVAENNVVKVYYGLDEYGPDSLEEGDGIPDSHQAKVVFHIEGGTWDGSDANDRAYVYTLETQGDDGQWTAVAPAPVLGGNVPTGMKPASGNEDKVGGWHLETKAVTIDANTPVTGNATYVYNYEQKFEAEKTAAEDLPDLGEDLLFTITVENKTEAETLTDIVVSEAAGNLIVKVDGVELENPVRVYTIETLAAGAKTDLTAAHTVTEADIAKGSYKNEATVSCQGAVIELTDEGETAEVNNEITTTKTIDKLNTRPTGEGGKYALGDTVRYLITATNTGNQTLSNVTVTEQEGVTILADDPATYAVTCDPSTGIYTATLIGTLAPGGKLTVYAELTVSGEDILKGKVVNEAAVSALAADGETSVEPQEQPKDENAETEAVKAKLDFEKTAKVYDKDSHELKEKAAVGDTVEFTFHVVNSGNVPVKGATVSDTMLGYTGTPTDLAVGEEFTETKEYTVTEADVLSGSIENSATVTGEAEPEGSDPVEARTDASTEVPTEDVKAEFEFGKAFVAEEPAKEYYLPGETVNYALTVKNKGNVSLKNVVVTEQKGMTVLPGDGYKVESGKAVIETLAPDATVTVSVSHKLTEKEVLKGTLKNVATVKADKITDPKTGEDVEPKAEASNSDAPLGKTTYTVVYKYDGTEGTAPSATAPVKGEGCVGDVTEVTGVPATASYYGVSYALDEVVQIKLDKDASKNTVIVSYAADKLGNDPDDPEKPAKPDGVPDKYQATVTFQVENGYWDNGRDRDQKVVYTLYEQVEGEWKLKETAPTLEKLPVVGEGKSGYPLAYGWKENIDETTPVKADATYTYHFGTATVEPIGDKTYTGEPIVPDASEIVVKDEQGRTIDPANYEVTVTDNTNVGEAVVTVTFKNELSGEIEGEFDIVPKEHDDRHDNTKPKQDDPAKPDYNPGDFRATTDPIDPQHYTGEPIEPTVVVRDEKGKKLVPGVDYEVVGYENNVEPGTATVKVELKGNYEGELEASFKIDPNGYVIVPPTDPQGNPYDKYEVDGEPDTVEDVDGEELIVRESPDAFVATGTNYSDHDDPHDKYPTDMTTEILVYNPETGRFDVVKSYFDLIRYEGCSIRIGGSKRGLRVVSSISRKFKDELINRGVELNGKVYRMTEYGTLMAWTKELGDRTLRYELIAEGIAKYGVAFSKRSDLLYQQTAERDYWCNVVTSKDGKLTDAQICTDMTLRPYVVMTADDGSTFYIYGGEVVRSIGSVAVQNQDVYAPGTWEDEDIEELVDIYKKKGSEF